MAIIHFKATPYTINDWTVLKLPPDASLQLPSRGQVMVKGSVNGAAFQTALEPDGNGGHWLNLDNDLQSAAHADAGRIVAVDIEATKDWPEPTIPDDVQAALSADAPAYKQWSVVTPMARWEWIRWINSTSQPDTRLRRIEVSCSKLRNGERRPCCFNRNMCCIPEVSKNGVLLDPETVAHHSQH